LVYGLQIFSEIALKELLEGVEMLRGKIAKFSLITGIIMTALGMAPGVWIASAAPTIQVVRFTGQVEVRNSQHNSWQKASNSSVLESGDSIRTGPQSQAEIRFEEGMMTLYENTILEFPVSHEHQKVGETSGTLWSVILQKGHSLFQVFKSRSKSRFEVITPSFIAGVKGTTFHVLEGANAKAVIVSEGLVKVSNRQFPEEEVEVMASHYTMLLDEHLTEIRELQFDMDFPFEDGQLEQHLKSVVDQKRDLVRNDRELLGDENRELLRDLEDESRTLILDIKDTSRDLMTDLLHDEPRIEDPQGTSNLK
jgi:hypothetical protein